MAGELENKVALVTGAGSGIGRAIALTFANAGAKTVLCDINQDGGQETLELINKQGGSAVFYKTDVSSAADVSAAVDFAVSQYGRLDCACNNAAIPMASQDFTEVSEEEFDHLVNINLKGVWLCMKYQIPELLKQPKSAIVNIASVTGILGTPKVAPYSATKFGVIGLTKSAALDYAKTGLRVNSVCPGITHTPILQTDEEFCKELATAIPMGRLAEPQEMADAVLWLCSDQSSYVNGHSLVVDGAMSIP